MRAVALAIILVVPLGTAPVSLNAATFFWDPTFTAGTAGGGAGAWDNLSTGNWWDNIGASLVTWNNVGANTAVFGGAAGGLVTLNGGGITAGGLSFNTTGYQLFSSTLTLAAPSGTNSPVIAVNGIGARAIIDSIVAGSSGFTKTGAGTLLLSNNANSFGGDIAIKDGVLIITNASQLGTGTTAISVTGVAQTGNPGYSGGSLLLAGSSTASGTGLTLGREVSVSGRGPNAVNNTGGLVSVGYNTLSGSLTLGAAGVSENRVWATHGTTTITGGVDLGVAGVGEIFQGNGNWAISGVVTGSENSNDRFIKSGQLIGTTLWLQNSANTFTDSIRVDSGTVRVATKGALGLNVGTGSVDLNNGTLEVRTDAASDFAGRTLRVRNNTTGTVFVDHDLSGGLGIGTSQQNQTVTLGALIRDAGANVANFTFNGRNGYSISFTSALPAVGDYRGVTVTNNSSGTVTFNGNVWNANNATASTYTVQGNGDTVITGSVVTTAVANNLTKTGSGTFFYGGTAGTYLGLTTISAGTLSFSDVGGFGGTSQINIGNATTTSGALAYTGGADTLSKNILLNTTTANVYINASGTGALTLNGSILTTVNGAKTLVLGGTNTDDNTLASVYANSTGIHSLQKIGSGTWVLNPATNNTFTGSTTVSGGTLKLQESASDFDILPNAGAVIFNVDAFTQWAGGILTYLGAAASASTEAAGALTLTAGAGTLTLTPGSGGSTALTFASLAAAAAGTGLNVVASDGTVTLTGVATSTATTLPGNGHLSINGADFARSSGGTLVTPAYGTDAGFVVAGAALTAGNHNLVTGNTSSGALTISSLKISGGLTVAQTGLLTVNVGANTSGGILVNGGSATMSGTGVTTGGTGDLVIRVNGAGDQLTMAAPITSTTTGGLTKNGDGLLLLQGAQSYTGATTINQGEIMLDIGSRLGGAGASNNNNLVIRQDGTLDINGNSIGIAAFNGAGLVTNTGAAATLTIGNNNQSGVFSGLITGPLGILKAGTGTTMSLTGLNAFTGATTINTGTLVVNHLADIGSASGIGAGDGTSDVTNAASLVFGGGALVYTGANAQISQTTQSPSVSINRLFTLAGNGTIDSSGSFGAPTLTHAANSASLIFNNTAAVAFSGATGGRTLTLTGDSIGDNEMRLNLIDNDTPSVGFNVLSLTKAGGSLWILNPATSNTYTGTTTISGGALRVAAEGAAVQGLSATSPLVINGGVLETSGNFTRTLGAPVAGTPTVQIPGGASGFSAATTNRLVVTIAGGALTWGSADFNPSSLILGSSTALGETEITNGIDIGAATRTITANNNGNTGTMVTAGILSGVISGTGAGGNALIKNGGGVLMLGSANTYAGSTRVDGGNLIVTSIGTGGNSSLGASGALIYNGPNADLNALSYVGSGETADRDLTLQGSNFSANRTYRIDSSGAGALVWDTGTFAHTTRGDTVARILTLELRGSNTDLNQLNLVLTNSTNATFANVLNIAKNDGGVWVLNPSSPNTFTGSISANGGLLGLTSNGIGSASNIVFSNGGIFAHGGALTTGTAVQIANNTTAVFGGANAIILNGSVTLLTSNNTNPWTISNNLEGGALLTISGSVINAESGATIPAHSFNVRGMGSTVLSATINNAAGGSVTSLDIRVPDNASVTLSGATASTYTGSTLLGQGTLILNKDPGVAQFGASSQFVFDGGVLQAALPLTGADKIATQVTLGGDQATIEGSNSIEFGAATALLNSGGNRFLLNNLTSGNTLTISGQVNLTDSATARTLTIRGTGVTSITGVVANGSTGVGSLAFSGLGSLELTKNETATGTLTVNRNLVILSGANGSWNAGGFALNPTGILRLDNSGGNNVLGRLSNTGAFAGNGGTLDIIAAAGGSSHSGGALNLNNVQTYITMDDALGPIDLTFASVNFANPGSSLNLAGVPGLGTTNKVKFTAALAANAQINGVMPRTFIGGDDFATYDVTDGVKAFAAYNNSNDLNPALPSTDTMNVTANASLTANRTLNALKINGSGLTVGGAALNRLTLSAAAILNTGGDNTFSTPELAFGTNPGFFQVKDLTTLTVSSALFGTGGLSKGLTGTLELDTPTFVSSTTTVLNGKLVLNGGLNTLFPNQQLFINFGATLDLNGNAQYSERLNDPGTLPGTGGTITSLSGTGTYVANMAGSTTVATQIAGAVNFARVGGSTLAFESIQTYTGSTTLMGGITTLQDDATLLGTSIINLNGGTLFLNNNASLQTNVSDRVGDTIPIFMRDGTLTYTGKVSDASRETLGAITSAQGANTISANTGGTGTAGAVVSADLTIASLTRNAGTTVNFTGTNLGQPGNSSRITFTTPLTTDANGALGAWAIANSTDYAAYNTSIGIGIVGQGGYTGYDGTFASGNITEIPATANSLTTLTAATTTTGLLKIAGAFTNDIAFTNNTDVLDLQLGGILRSNNNNATSIGTTAIRGVITSGTSELVVYNNASGTSTSAATATTTLGSPVITTLPTTVGLEPGMTLTTANLPAGTYIVSVDGPDQITVSQNATAGTATNALVYGISNVIVNSVIQGAGTTLVKSGGGVLNLSANNTYAGGTTVVQGTVNLIGSGVVIPAGGIILGGAAMIMNTNAGQIDPTNAVTLRRSSTLTLVGDNTLDSLAFENTGGSGTPIVNTGGILTLTNATPITVLSNTPQTVATIAGSINIGTGARTIDTPTIQVDGVTVTRISPTLNISAAILSPGVTLTKTGAGILQLSGQSVFNGGLNLTAGGILISGNSTPLQGGGGLSSGPLGTGSVAAAAGTTFLVDGNRTIGNDIAFAGTPTFDSTANTVWTLTLNGTLSGAGMASPTPTIQVNNPFLTVALLGNIPNVGTITSFNRTGLGAVVFNSTGYTGDFNASALGNPNAVSLLNDGDGTSLAQTIVLGNVIFDAGVVPNITVSRAGGTLPFPLPANKIIQPASISNLGLGLTVTNGAGYGLDVPAAVALSGTPTISVSAASVSNVTQGLYLDGVLTGTGFIKTGAGTVVLGNAGNGFIGDVDIRTGVVSVASDALLGTGTNQILLNPTTGTSTFRATGTFATSRVIDLTVASSLRAVEVTGGNTLTLNTGFGLTAAAAGLIKADNGTLELTAANAGWSGPLTISGGAVKTALASSLGTGTILVNAPGSALQLQGVTVTNSITIASLTDNQLVTGIFTGGAIQGLIGSSTVSSTITVNATTGTDNVSRSYGFGAASGASLTLGDINLNHPTGGTSRNIIGYFGGAGDITLSGVLDNTNATPGANTFLFKFGSGGFTITAANAIPDTEVRFYRGGVTVNGAGSFGTGSTQVQVWQNATMTLDNSVTNTANRISNRVLQIGGGTLNYIPNAAGTTQTSTGALQISQGYNTINLAAGGNLTVTFASLTQNGGAVLNLTGTFGATTNKLTFTTAPTLSPAGTGLLARVLTNGTEFATYAASTGIGTFTGYAAATNILSAGATQTFNATDVTANSLTGNQTLNALKISSGGGSTNIGGLSGLNPTTLTLTSGGILVNGTGTTSTLSVPVVSFGATGTAEAIFHIMSGQTLDVTSSLATTGGMNTTSGGTLNLNSQQFVSGNTYVNGGTLNLESSATNTLLFNNGLGVNIGATVDLKNGVQFIGSLFSANAGGNTDIGGGTVTNSGAQATLVTNSNSSFGGSVQGTIFLNKTGVNGLTLTAANGYSGPTLITGGTLTVTDDGTIASTSKIDINYGALTMTNTGLRDNADRVSSAAIDMKGGIITLNGRAATNSSETIGTVNVIEGLNQILNTTGGTGINSSQLTLGSLTRSVGSTATVRFSVSGVIGSASRTMITAAPPLTNNIIGPWAVVDREWASYDPTYGVGALLTTGFAGYAGGSLNTNPLATDNIRLTATGTTTLLNGNVVVNTLNINNSTTAAILDLAGNTLRLRGGGMIIGQNTNSITVTVQNGNITSGVVGSPSDFYLFHGAFGSTGRAATISANIVDNALLGPVRLILSEGDGTAGTSTVTLSGTNTYTGGTVFNQGSRILGATGTLGSGGITVNQAIFAQTLGGIIPAQSLTMGGGSTVTLAGNNSLTGVTFNNMGGAAPNLVPTGVLTLTGGISVTTMNAGGVATIGAGSLDLNGAGSYSVNVGATLVNGQDVAPWQAGLIINSVIDNGGIAKSGAGLLQLGGQSTFSGGLTVSSGGLIIGANSTPNNLNDTVVTGPLGTGAVTMAANSTLVASIANAQVANNFTFLGDTVFNGVNSLTLNGTTTLPSIWNATVTAPQMTVTIGDASPSISSDVINKSGLGILVVGNYAGTIQATGGLVFTGDGNGLGTPEGVSLGGNLTLAGDTAITVNHSGGAPNARNKTLQKINLSVPGNIMSVSNQSGYGLEFTGTSTMTGPSHFAVGVATVSNLVQGLILSGVVDDGASNFSMTKSGPGTLVLSNAGNTFGSALTTIDVLNGVLSVPNDGALGNAGSVTLDVDGSVNVGFRATGTFSSGRTFNLNQANNAMEVTGGNTLTLTAPFVLSAAANTLTKNDNGVLAINANNTGWTGAITINAGAIRVLDANAIGTGAVTINNATSSALQLDGGVSFGSAITLVTNGASGFNSAGVIEAVSGANTLTGLVTQNSGSAVVYGADAGATLNVNGNIATGNSATFNVGTLGIINLNSVYGNGGAGGPSFVKIGTGTLNVTVNQAAVTSAVVVNQGTLNISGSGVGIGITGSITINSTGTLEIDDSIGAPSAHMNNRPVTLQGGTFSYDGNTANSAEVNTSALTFARGGGIFIANANGAATNSLTFASLALGTDATANFQGVNLGTASNKVLFTTAPTLVPASTGILARATVNGSTFATYGANGIAGFTAYNASVSITTPAATDTVDVTAAMTTLNLTATKTINAIRFSNPAGSNVGGAAFNQLVLTTGGVLATGGGSNTLSVPVLNNAAVQDIFHVASGTTLNVTSAIVGTAGLVKDGDGTLVLTPNNFAGVSANTITGVMTVARGTLQLAGGTNTLTPNQFLVMGGAAATLDLNGTSQQILGLLTDTTAPGSGGSIIGGAGSQLVINADNTARTWAGSINGSVNIVRSGQNTLTFVSGNSASGATLINGGTTVLQSDATLSGTGALDINFATLSADNNAGLSNITDRINDSKLITLRGATLTVQGRAQTASSEALGEVRVNQGFNVINPLVGGAGVNSMDLSLDQLLRPAGSSATLIVQGTNLGTIGSNSRVTVTTLNGVATTSIVYSPNGSGLTNNIVGGWAENGNDFLTYIPGLGLAPLNQVGAAQYDLNNTLVGATPIDNVRLTATTSVPNGGATVNAVSMSGSNIALNFTTGTDTLNLSSGGLIGPNNNQNIGATLDSGRLTAGGPTPAANSDLYIFNRANTLTINSRIIDNVSGGGSSVRAVFTASGGAITVLNPNNSYTGGTVLNGGTLNLNNTAAAAVIPAGGLEINGGTVTMNNFAGQIDSSNIVTLNNGILNYAGNNTQAGFVMNNIGGAGNPVVQSFSTTSGVGLGSTGVLTVGASGITATSSNVGTTNIFVGRIDFGAGLNTVTVDPINANGIDVAPLQAALALQGIVGSAGGINKLGNGVLQFNAQDVYTGPTIVSAGSIRNGVTNAGSRFSALTVTGAGFYNLAGITTTWGSLAGSGTIFNNSTTATTLAVGFDNSPTTTFSGQLARFNDAVMTGVALQKIGTGELVMDSAQSLASGTTSAITVNGGVLKYRDAGKAFTGTAASGGGTFALNNGGIIALNNANTVNVNNRLGLNAIGALSVQGGKLTINGNSGAATPTTEAVATFNVLNGGGRVELTPDPANPLTLAITTLSSANGNGSLVIGGITGAASADGVASLTITTPNLIGGQGAGANGTVTMGVRHDILADASVSGLGSGFLVKDSVTNNYRALAPGELAASMALPLTTDVDPITGGNQSAGTLNVGLTGGTQSLIVNSVANTLTFSGVNTIDSGLGAAFGDYGPGGNLLTLSLSNAAASLTLGGATTTISVGAFGSTSTGTTPYVHVVAGGTLNVNAAFAVNGTAGMLKADGGTLTLNNLAYYTGATTINDGTLNLASGSANTLVVVPTAGAPTVSQVNLNGTTAVLDLMGQNQVIGALTSINPLPGNGGTVQNSGGAATLTSTGGGTFSGTITDPIAFTRAGNNTTLLTNANTYAGATIVRGGVLQLRDSGSISSTAGLTLNYGTLLWDNFGLNTAAAPNPVRIAAVNALTLQGGTFTVQGGGSIDTTATLNTVTVARGHNTINALPFVNEGSTVELTIGNLVRPASNHSSVNFNGFTTNNSGGTSTIGGAGLTANGNIILNAVTVAMTGAVTTANSNVVTVPTTAGLFVGAPVTGAGLPANERVTAITSPTTFTITTGTGVTAQASTTLTAVDPIVNLAIAGAATTTGSNIVTVPSTTGLVIGLPVSGTGLPANEFITAITSSTTFTVTTATGVTTQASTTITANNLNNGLIGGWAVADGNTFATYVTNFGVSVMGQTTQGIAAPGFTGTDITSTVATGNYSDSGTGTTTITRTMTTGAKAANSWRISQSGAATNVVPVSGTTYSFGVGIITNNNQTVNIQAVDATNTLTGTGADLYVYINQATTIIQPAIVGSAALISSGPATLSLRPQFASNTYTGGTFVQNGTLNLQAAATFIAIPGDLTITNGAVTMSTTPNQIAVGSDVTINGGGTLTLANYSTGPTQTLASLTFVNEGGNGNPTLSLGTPTVAVSTLVFSSPTPITATNNSLATTPTISTGAAALTALQFSDPNPVITVNAGLAETGLTISAPITQNGSMLSLSKGGVGALALSGQSTFTTGLNLNQGSLILGASSTPTTGAVTSGPVGTGTLTIAGGTTILSDGTVRTVANTVTVNGDFTVGGRVAGNGVTLNGAIDLGAANRTVTVTSPAVTLTLGGAITTSVASATGLTKAGPGILTLTAAQTDAVFGGVGTAAGILVTGGILKNGIANAVANGSLLTVSAGTGYDLNGFGEIIQQIAGNGFITNSANSSQTLVIGGTAATDAVTNLSYSFGGILTDNILAAANSRLVLIKSGIGTITLASANSYSGLTTVNNGILSISNSSALGTTTGASSVTAGASLELKSGISVGNELLTINGTGSASNGALRNLSGTNTWAGTVTLGSNSTITSDAGLLTIDVASGSAITGIANLTVEGAGDTTVADGITTGSGSVTKNGAGTLTLSGTNTYTGPTTINAGTVTLVNGAAIADTDAVVIANAAGATLKLNNSETIGSLAGGGATGGTVNLQANTLSAGADDTSTTFSGVISGSGQLTKVGIGTMTLDGTVANTYTGLTTVSAGTLELNKTGVNAIVSNVALGGFDKITDIQVLSGGTLTFLQSEQIADSSKITVAAGGTVNFSTNASHTETLYDLINAGTVNYGPGTVDIGDPTWLVGSTNTITGTTRVGNLFVSGGTNNVNAGASLQVGSGNLTFTDPDAADSGPRNISVASSAGTAGTLRLGRTTVPGEDVTVFFTGTGATTASITSSGVGANPGLLDLGDGGTGLNRTFDISDADAAVDVSISTRITGAASVGLTKVGAGTMALSGSNTYTGVTKVNAGTLQFATQVSLYNNVTSNWTDTNLVVESGATAAFNVGGAGEFTLTPSGDIDTIKVLGTASGGFKNGSKIGLDTTNAGGSASYNSVIADTNTGANSIGFTKLGSGILALTAATGNTYTGGTAVKAGTLQVSNTSGSGTGTGAVAVSGASVATTGTGGQDDPVLRNGPSVAVLAGSGRAGGATTVGSSPTLVGVLRPGDSGGSLNGTLTIGTSTSHTLTVADLSQIQLGMTTSTQNDTAFNVSGQTALQYLDANGGTSGTPYTTIWGLSGGSNYDTLKVTGDITLGTGGATLATIAATEVGTGTFVTGMIFKLIDWNSVGTATTGAGSVAGLGSFNSLTDFILPTQGGTLGWDTTAFTKYGVVTVTTGVPEPGRLLLMFFGLAALFLRRRRSR